MDRTYNNHMLRVALAIHKPVYTVYRYIVNIAVNSSEPILGIFQTIGIGIYNGR